VETLQGTVKNLNRSTQVSGGRSSVQTANVTVFELAGQSVSLRDREAIVINEGDEMVVAGKRGRDGIFRAAAYNNLTRKVHGGSSGMSFIISGILLLISPILIYSISTVAPEYAAFSLLLCSLPFSLILAILGAVLLFFALRQRRAWKAVESAPPAV
jgi:hypothetical protein